MYYTRTCTTHAHVKELDDTLVVFTADHGCVAKGHCFEPSMRVPLFAHCPNLIFKRGGGAVVVDAVVANIDIAPTLLDAAGVDQSWLRQGGERIVDGRSVLPLVAPNHARYNPSKQATPFHPPIHHATFPAKSKETL